MKAIIYDAFKRRPELRELPDPVPGENGVVIQVMATGLCRSDWHGWVGHDTDIRLPHVPGHEFAGVITEIGKRVSRWKIGDRVTMPFVAGCGECPQCYSGNHQLCDNQFQPGFTGWGSFAEFVAVDYADVNLVRLPGSLDFSTAAGLGCRFVTSFRALVDQGRLSAGEWVAVHGCGGVGLSAIMIADALGANVIAVDIADHKLELAKKIGASFTINSRNVESVTQEVVKKTNGGAHLSIDALGHPDTCCNSIANLRKRGRHIQVGLMLGENTSPGIPMAQVIANELEIRGSHGIQAYRYEALWEMIGSGKLKPERLIGRTIGLEESIEALVTMDEFNHNGITIINPQPGL